jgi:hypothetical protein
MRRNSRETRLPVTAWVNTIRSPLLPGLIKLKLHLIEKGGRLLFTGTLLDEGTGRLPTGRRCCSRQISNIVSPTNGLPTGAAVGFEKHKILLKCSR